MEEAPKKVPLHFTPWEEKKLDKNVFSISVTKGGVTLLSASLLHRLEISSGGSVDFYFDPDTMSIAFRFHTDRDGRYGILENNGSYKLSTSSLYHRLLVDTTIARKYYLASNGDYYYFHPLLIDAVMAKTRWLALREGK